MDKVCNDSDVGFSQSVKYFDSHLFLYNDNVRLNLGQLLLYDLYPVVLLIDNVLDLSQFTAAWLLNLACPNTLFQEKDRWILNSAVHSFISYVLTHDDAIDVGGFGVVLPINDLDLDERVEVH